jgi:hypothetical protein
MEQTAVEYAIQEIEKLAGIKIARDEDCIEQAKEMEKQQIDDAHFEGFSNGFNDLGRIPFKYYYETYNK